MKKNIWFRLHADFMHDPKVQMMSENMQRRLVMLFCMRCNGNETFQDNEIIFSLRISQEEWEKTKALFISNNFIDESNAILNWEKRQYLSDVSTLRVKKHRQKCNGNETFQKRPQITDTDTEKNPPCIPPSRGGGCSEIFKLENKNPAKPPRRVRGERLEAFMAREFPVTLEGECPQEWGEAAVGAAVKYRPQTKTDFTKIVNWHFEKFYNHFKSSTKANALKSDWHRAWINWWKTEFEKIAKQEELNEFYAQKRA